MDRLWKEAMIVLDANVLLNIYRYPDETRRDFFRLLKRVGDRLWVPYQAAEEFYRNRLKVIADQRKKFGALSSRLNEAIGALQDGQFAKSEFLDLNSLRKILEPAVIKAQGVLADLEKQHPDLLDDDPYLDELVKLVGERVGVRPTAEAYADRCKAARKRFEDRLPPGFMDQKKPEPDRYGDALLWFEVIDLARSTQKGVIVVTDDEKEDWWLVAEGKKFGARPELRAEIMDAAGVNFAVARPASFLRALGAAKKESIEFAEKLTYELSRRSREWRLASSRRNYHSAGMDSPVTAGVMGWLQREIPGIEWQLREVGNILVARSGGVRLFSLRVYVVTSNELPPPDDVRQLVQRAAGAMRFTVFVFPTLAIARSVAPMIEEWSKSVPRIRFSVGCIEEGEYIEARSLIRGRAPITTRPS